MERGGSSLAESSPGTKDSTTFTPSRSSYPPDIRGSGSGWATGGRLGPTPAPFMTLDEPSPTGPWRLFVFPAQVRDQCEFFFLMSVWVVEFLNFHVLKPFPAGVRETMCTCVHTDVTCHVHVRTSTASLTLRLCTFVFSGSRQDQAFVHPGQLGHHHHRCPGHGPHFHQPAVQHQHLRALSSGKTLLALWGRLLLPPIPVHGSDGYPSPGKHRPLFTRQRTSLHPRRALCGKGQRPARTRVGSNVERLIWVDGDSFGKSSLGWRADLDAARLTETSVWLSHVPKANRSVYVSRHPTALAEMVALAPLRRPLRLGSSLRAQCSRRPSQLLRL